MATDGDKEELGLSDSHKLSAAKELPAHSLEFSPSRKTSSSKVAARTNATASAITVSLKKGGKPWAALPSKSGRSE